MKTSKTIAVVAVMFMLCAGIAVVINGSEVSDAANKTIDYQFNLQLNNGTDKLNVNLPVQTASELSKENYISSLKAALDADGFTYVMSTSGWLTSITKGDITYAGSGTWGEAGYYGFAIYYPADDGWESVSSYEEASIISIVLDEYKFTDPQSAKYYDSGFGYWSLLPTKNPVDFTDGKYHFNLQLNNGEKSLNVWLKEQSTSSLSKQNYISSLKAALDADGFTYVMSTSGWLTSITKDGVTYAGSGTWGEAGYYGFAMYYADGQSWLATSSYAEGNVFSIVLDEYKFTDPQSDAYLDSGYGYWSLLPTQSTDGYGSGDGASNMVLYIAIAVVLIVIVVAVVFFITKKKA